MGYWLGAAGNYWEGDRVDPTDIEVTQRPYYTCDWDTGTSTWNYNLPDTRTFVKNIWLGAMQQDVTETLAAAADPSNMFIGMCEMAAFIDSVTYTDNVANNTPFYDGYQAVSGLANTAAVHAAMSARYNLQGEILGKILAQMDIDFALMDAAVTGPDIVAIVYVRPF